MLKNSCIFCYGTEKISVEVDVVNLSVSIFIIACQG